MQAHFTKGHVEMQRGAWRLDRISSDRLLAFAQYQEAVAGKGNGPHSVDNARDCLACAAACRQILAEREACSAAKGLDL